MVVFREADFDVECFADFVTDDAFFKTGDKAAASQFQLLVFGGAAVECHAVDFSYKVDVDLVAFFGGAVVDINATGV